MMEAFDRDLLRKNHSYLVEKINLNDLFISFIKTEDLFCRDSLEEIQNQTTTSEKNRKFLEGLKRRGPNAMAIFLKALEFSGQTKIKDKLIIQTCTEPSLNLRPDNIQIPKLSELTYELYVTLSKDQLIEFEPSIDCNTPRDCYPVSCRNGFIGYAVIINLIRYENKYRYGSEYDCGYLQDLFDKLKIKNTTYSSIVASEELVKNIKIEAEFIKNNAQNYSFFICCLMAHGANGCIITPDEKKIKYQNIYDSFQEGSDVYLEIPKIFVIQACQIGSNFSTSESNNDEMDENINIRSFNINSLGDNDSLSSTQEIYSPDIFVGSSIPEYVKQSFSSSGVKNAFNQAFLFATVPGCNAYLSKSSGSIFIKSLVFVISRYHQSEDLASMMIAVTRILKGIKDDNGNVVQCPGFYSTNSKKIYLRTT